MQTRRRATIPARDEETTFENLVRGWLKRTLRTRLGKCCHSSLGVMLHYVCDMGKRTRVSANFPASLALSRWQSVAMAGLSTFGLSCVKQRWLTQGSQKRESKSSWKAGRCVRGARVGDRQERSSQAHVCLGNERWPLFVVTARERLGGVNV